MAECASAQDEENPALATRLAHWGFSALVPQVKVLFFRHVINPLLTKLVRSRWPNIGLGFLCVFIDRDK